METPDGSFTIEDSFPMIGGSINLLLNFVEDNGGSAAFKDLTTDDVKNVFVLPATAQTQLSMCQQLQANGDNRIGRPSWFVSHAWKYSFLHLLQVALRLVSSHRPPLSRIAGALQLLSARA
jgi:hypothetical protein